LGSNLQGVCYVLDEPTIGLHPRDNAILLKALARLSAQGNTLFIFDEPTTGLHFHDINRLMKAFDALIRQGHSLVVIEHNLDVVKCADYVIDLGPEGGDNGGTVVFQGRPVDLCTTAESYTGKYLASKFGIV
jgi:excinuclease ABC subunit A